MNTVPLPKLNSKDYFVAKSPGVKQVRIKGRISLTMQIRLKSKKQLEQIKKHLRETTNPNASMTLVMEQLIDKEHKRLKL